MLTQIANGDSRLSFWLRVREFAVPPSMIETATARRAVGDWAGACAAARVDVDLDLRAVARTHGRGARGPGPGRSPPSGPRPAALAHAADRSRRAAAPGPDHLPGPVRRGRARRRTPVHLVARTPPAWADAGQRISLALWDGSRSEAGARRHPHPHPDRRFRLDLHRHLWDARRAGELRVRSGADRPPRPAAVPGPDAGAAGRTAVPRAQPAAPSTGGRPRRRSCSRAEGRTDRRRRRAVRRPAPAAAGPGRGPGRATGLGRTLRITAAPGDDGVAAAAGPARRRDLGAARPGAAPRRARSTPTGCIRWSRRRWYRTMRRPGRAAAPGPARGSPRLVECRGARHRIGLVDGVLVAAGPRPGRDPPRGAAGRAGRHAAALPAGDRRGAPSPGLPRRRPRPAGPRRHRRCAGRRRRPARPRRAAARRRAAGRAGGGRAAADHLRAVPGRPGRTRGPARARPGPAAAACTALPPAPHRPHADPAGPRVLRSPHSSRSRTPR